MGLGLLLVSWSLLCLIMLSSPVAAQLPPVQTDPLGKPVSGIQGASACSATEVSSCAEAGSKILAQVMGPSPMEGNLRRLTDEIGGRVTGTPQMANGVELGPGSFPAAGIEGSEDSHKRQ